MLVGLSPALIRSLVLIGRLSWAYLTSIKCTLKSVLALVHWRCARCAPSNRSIWPGWHPSSLLWRLQTDFCLHADLRGQSWHQAPVTWGSPGPRLRGAPWLIFWNLCMHVLYTFCTHSRSLHMPGRALTRAGDQCPPRLDLLSLSWGFSFLICQRGVGIVDKNPWWHKL